ncbi:hypothetical protein WR25_21177 [Diploscapter pachys]|uniref:Uncharacterized protein n=1 Tax=Diploscapter pachys TaxID=2018661 RepID=A0A2A2LD06_9BILA|nr:hypothetical protein WR25_21177 [Diploscapter pachys]
MLILTSYQDSYEDDESPEEQIMGRAPAVNKQKRVPLWQLKNKLAKSKDIHNLSGGQARASQIPEDRLIPYNDPNWTK